MAWTHAGSVLGAGRVVDLMHRPPAHSHKVYMERQKARPCILYLPRTSLLLGAMETHWTGLASVQSWPLPLLLPLTWKLQRTPPQRPTTRPTALSSCAPRSACRSAASCSAIHPRTAVCSHVETAVVGLACPPPHSAGVLYGTAARCACVSRLSQLEPVLELEPQQLEPNPSGSTALRWRPPTCVCMHGGGARGRHARRRECPDRA